MAWEENSRICLHMQLIAILSRTGVKVHTAYAGEMRMKISSLRNLLSVACLFQPANLLNRANEPTHELVNNVAARSTAETLRCLIFIILFSFKSYFLNFRKFN